MSAPIMPCDVLGYYYGGEMLEAACPECFHEQVRVPRMEADTAPDREGDTPIFRDSEADTPTHCALCAALIPHALTPDGIEYVREAVAALEAGDGRREIVGQWRDRYLEGGAA